MKKMIILVLAMTIASSAFAIIDPQPNSMGFYFDLGANVIEATGPAYDVISVHVILVNPTFSELGGVEFGYELIGGIPMDISWPASSVDFGTFGNHICGFGTPIATTLATWVATITIQPIGPLSMTLRGTQPSSINPLQPALTINGGVIIPGLDSTGIGNVNFTYNNSMGVVATENMSFDGVKSLYR